MSEEETEEKGVPMYSMRCLDCLKVWFSTTRDFDCPFCGSEVVYDRGGRK